MAKRDRFFVAFDKTPIHYEFHAPAHKKNASLLIVHGAQEHAGRYGEFADFLSQNSIEVYAMDMRGYGRSGGPRAFARNFGDYGRDLEALARKIQTEGPEPLFLLGHSLGGLISSHAAAFALPDRLSGLLLSSPCFGLAFRVPGHLRLLSEFMAAFYPTFLHKTPVLPESLTHDTERIAEYRKDPFIVPVISSRLFTLMLREFLRVRETAAKIRCPVFVAQAGVDRIVDVQAARVFFESLSVADKQFKIYEGLFHEVLNETLRRTVYQDILNWVKNHTLTGRGPV